MPRFGQHLNVFRGKLEGMYAGGMVLVAAHDVAEAVTVGNKWIHAQRSRTNSRGQPVPTSDDTELEASDFYQIDHLLFTGKSPKVITHFWHEE